MHCSQVWWFITVSSYNIDLQGKHWGRVGFHYAKRESDTTTTTVLRETTKTSYRRELGTDQTAKSNTRKKVGAEEEN